MAKKKSAFLKVEALDKLSPADRMLNGKAVEAVSKLEELLDDIKDSPMFQWVLSQMQYNIQKRVNVIISEDIKSTQIIE